jgi:type I restriction enzyme S subunit
MRPLDPQLTPYLNLYLNSDHHGRRQYEEFIYGAGRPHLSFDQLRATSVSLPPLVEQREIVRRVEALFALADKIEQRAALASRRAERLTQAILARAFRGELVPTEAELARREGRDYEPASKLLERIAAARGAATAQRRPRQRRNGTSQAAFDWDQGPRVSFRRQAPNSASG